MAQTLQKFPRPGDETPPYSHVEFPSYLYGPPLTEEQEAENEQAAADGKPARHVQKSILVNDPDEFEEKVATGKWFDTPRGEMENKPQPPTVEAQAETEAQLADALEANDQLTQRVQQLEKKLKAAEKKLGKEE